MHKKVISRFCFLCGTRITEWNLVLRHSSQSYQNLASQNQRNTKLNGTSRDHFIQPDSKQGLPELFHIFYFEMCSFHFSKNVFIPELQDPH